MLQLQVIQITANFIDDVLPLPIKLANETPNTLKNRALKKKWDTNSSFPNSLTIPTHPWTNTLLLTKLSFIEIFFWSILQIKYDTFEGITLFQNLI